MSVFIFQFGRSCQYLFSSSVDSRLISAGIITLCCGFDSSCPFFASLRALIIIRSVSPEYDAYLKSTLEKMHAHFSFEDPTSWLEEVDTYSNIEGGLGIFGAWADRVLYISPIP